LIKSPALIEKLGEGKEFIVGPYQEWVSWIKSGMTGGQYKKVLYETYVKTRPLGYSDPIRESSVSSIMPILDFMNHHWEGGAFAVAQMGVRLGDLMMHISQPIKGSLECYANYGVMDAFDSLIRYDFVDETSPVIRSIAIDLEGPAGDRIEIQNKISYTHNKELDPTMQDLRRYIPDITVKDSHIVASHIFLPAGGKSKFALVRALNLILGEYNKLHNKTLTEAEAKAWRRKAQEEIIEKNQAWYNSLLAFIEKLPAEQKGSFGVQRVKDMALHQLKKLGEYQIQD